MKNIIAVFAFCTLASVCAMDNNKQIISRDLEAQPTLLTPPTNQPMILPSHLSSSTDLNQPRSLQQPQNQQSTHSVCIESVVGTIGLLGVTFGASLLCSAMLYASSNF